MKVLLKNNSLFEDAQRKYKYFIADERARAAYQARSMFLHDQASLMKQSREEGFEEGFEEGKEEGRAKGIEEGRVEGREEGRREGTRENAIETARKLRSRGMPKTDIKEITGLSSDQLETL